MTIHKLSELEGAILTEIGHRGNDTSFKVRRAFERSPSSSWSGSAGAVYPAIKRLIASGLIDAQATGSGRGTRMLSVTPKGRAALQDWCVDPIAACALGADPFRLRAGLWAAMPAEARRQVYLAMLDGVRHEMKKLRDRDDLDPVEATGNDLARQLQQMRAAWLVGVIED
jgi:DNA-binding PadR family transcriptional regulator